jgi:peptidoglycan/LPS O-acetylase OafA/YrhL
MSSALQVDPPLRQSSGLRRLAHIDALRAIAALLVVWMHVSQIFYTLSPQTTQSRWVYDCAMYVDVGRIGVVLFFAISGFVIPFSIHPGSRAPVRDFLLRRLFRILPAYWLSIPLGAYASHVIWGRPVTLLVMLQNATLLQYLIGWPPTMGLYWTLALEMLFYLVCAALLYLRSIDNYMRVAILAGTLMTLQLASVALYHSGNFTTVPYLKALWAFHLGIMFWGTLFRAWLDGRMTDGFAITCTWLMTVFLLALYPAYCFIVVKLPLYYYIPYPIAASLFIAGTTFAKLHSRALQWVGEISYSVYLVHPIVFNLLLWGIQRTAPGSAWRTQHLAAYVLASTALSIVIAACAYRWVEKPAIALGRRLAGRWFSRGTPADARVGIQPI